MSAGGVAIGGGGLLILLIIGLCFGVDVRPLLNQAQQQQAAQGPGVGRGGGAAAPVDPAEEEAKKFISVVLADTEDVWNNQFRELGRSYKEPKLVLFTGKVQSACGFASAAVGPFYCPGDENVYIDLSFFDELKQKYGAPGDFAQAYVLAHEVGHHVQNLLGVSDRVSSLRRRLSEEEYNKYSVCLELQADFYAGVWAHHAQKSKQILEIGDIEEGMRAAAAVGDDRIQMKARGYVVPESFTHGSAEQRMKWFRKGLASGDMRDGDTFGEAGLRLPR
jgi:predicted metalloprotease